MPNGKTHAYGSPPKTGAVTSYTPPGAGAQLTGLRRRPLPGPHDAAGPRHDDVRRARPTAASTGVGDSTWGYDSPTDRFTSATRGGKTTAIGYDGGLKTAVGEHAYTYNDDLRLSSMQLAGSAKLDIGYDGDGLVTGYGPFELDRSGPMGEPVAVSDDALDLALAYDDGGRQRSRTLTVKGAKRYELNVTRDDAGRITRRVETVAGTAKTYDYEYWPDGELKTVRNGATVLESYTYDANGNRGGHTYADDDRMTGTHTFDAAGFLVTRGADTFNYADRGELLAATVAGRP